MTLGSIGSYGGTQTTGTTPTNNTKSIEDEIKKLQQQIKQLQQDDQTDAKTKTQQIAVYQAQIAQLQAQASQSAPSSSASGFSMDVQKKFDTVSISEEARNYMNGPPPLDFENMSDDEFTTWLTNMQNETGAIPGAERYSSVGELTADELAALRQTLTAAQQERMGVEMGGTPPQYAIQNDMVNAEDM